MQLLNILLDIYQIELQFIKTQNGLYGLIYTNTQLPAVCIHGIDCHCCRGIASFMRVL